MSIIPFSVKEPFDLHISYYVKTVVKSTDLEIFHMHTKLTVDREIEEEVMTLETL